jgi:hypothetical protein
MYLQKILKATKRKSTDRKGSSSNRMQGKNRIYKIWQSMQCKHTWYAQGFRNQNPRHGETAPILGESTPPQGVNVLVCDWPHSVWTKSLVRKDAVLQGILLFRSVSEDSALLAS